MFLYFPFSLLNRSSSMCKIIFIINIMDIIIVVDIDMVVIITVDVLVLF